jgi:ferric-dicitrate binding protein FerR (iron transport regulator)
VSNWDKAADILDSLNTATCVDPDNEKLLRGLVVVGGAVLIVAEEMRLLREALVVAAAHVVAGSNGTPEQVNFTLAALAAYAHPEPQK